MLTRFRDTIQDLYGYKDDNGAIAIRAAYEKAKDFVDDIAIVHNGSKWGLINVYGETILPFEYDSIVSQHGWVQARKEEQHYLFSSQGILHLHVSNILSWHFPSEELIRIKKQTGWGCINMKGEEIVPFIYKSVGPCCYGRFSFYENGCWGWRNQTGQIITNARFDEVGFWNHRYWWARKNGEYEIHNFSDEVICSEGWIKFIPDQNGLSAIKTQDEWKYINSNLSMQLHLPPVYDWAELFSDGLAAVKRNNAWGFINTNGEEVIAAVFEKVTAFSEGLAAVKQNGLWGYINTAGVLAIPCIYEKGGAPFQNGKAWVQDAYGYDGWYINRMGEIVSEKYPLDD